MAYVIRGEVAFGIGEHESVARPGTLVQLPGGTTHWFRFGPGGGEMLSMTSRAGAAAFFTEVDRKIAPQNPDVDELDPISWTPQSWGNIPAEAVALLRTSGRPMAEIAPDLEWASGRFATGCTKPLLTLGAAGRAADGSGGAAGGAPG